MQKALPKIGLQEKHETLPYMEIIIVAAISKNLVLGKDNALVWDMPADKRFFHATVAGAHLLMGRKTHQSAALEGYIEGTTELVITRQAGYAVKHGKSFPSIEEGIKYAESIGEKQLFVLGGGSVYAQSMSFAHKMILTEIDMETEGDAFFPVIDREQWEELKRERHPADAENAFPYAFVTYRNRAQS